MKFTHLFAIKTLLFICYTTQAVFLTDKSEEEIKKIIATHDVVALIFTRTGCPACAVIKEKFDEIAADPRLQNITLVEYDVVKEPEPSNGTVLLTKTYDIMYVPTLVILKKGNVVDTKTGFTDKESLINAITNALQKNPDDIAQAANTIGQLSNTLTNTLNQITNMINQLTNAINSLLQSFMNLFGNR